MSPPPTTLPSHLALLARLELLHQSGILSSSSAFDAPSYLAEHDAEPLQNVKGGWEGQGGGDEAWREVRDMLRLLGDGLRDGQCATSPPYNQGCWRVDEGISKASRGSLCLPVSWET
jgi:hypothetical protein